MSTYQIEKSEGKAPSFTILCDGHPIAVYTQLPFAGGDPDYRAALLKASKLVALANVAEAMNDALKKKGGEKK